MADAPGLWDRLSPRARQWTMWSVGAAVVLPAMWLFATAPAENDGTTPEDRQRSIKNLLTDVDPRDLGMDGLARRLSTLEGDVKKIAYTLQHAGLSIDEDTKQSQLVETLRREREDALDEVRHEVALLRDDIMAAMASGSIAPETAAHGPLPEAPDPTPQPERPAALPATELPAPVRTPEPPPLESLFERASPSRGSNSAATAAPPRTLNIRVVRTQPPKPEEVAAAIDDAIPDVRITGGTILRGVLLSGMDAPTRQAARQDPYPALLRIKHDAILPNRYRADVRECFLLVSGYGDLGSERVYLRTESINCVRSDGRTIEVAVDGYAVGEDGKLGIRGRLVNKQGQVIGNAMRVAFLQGFSQLFSTVPVASVSTAGSTTQPYQQVFSPQAMQGAAASGAGEAMNRLAEYYLDLAEDMHPVLEVDAGRGVEVVLTRGVALKIETAGR